MAKILTKDEIIERLGQKREALPKYKVRQIGLFGSYVRNEQRENSDIDFLVEFERGVTLFDIIELENFLTQLFGKKASVVSKNGLSKYLGPHILKEAEPIGKRL